MQAPSPEPIYTATGQLNFGRDSSGIINTITGDNQLSATYDADLEITGAQHMLPQPINESYSYDTRGNRLTSSANTFTYDDLNRLTSSTINTYTYDADGNMTMEKNPLTGERKVFTYDSENRMVKYEHYATDVSPVDITATYTYDLFGRRLQKNINGAIINFYWEGDTVGLELDANYQPICKYIPKGDSITGCLAKPRHSDAITGAGMDDYEGHLEYSEMTDWSHIFDNYTQQAWYSYMRDQVGTIYQIYDHKNHAIAETRAYDTFGNLVNQTGTRKTNFGFQGKYYEQESGLNYFYNRYYSPTIGRFITEDPIGFVGGMNFYSFVLNNPIRYLDSFGFKCDKDPCAYLLPNNIPPGVDVNRNIAQAENLNSILWFYNQVRNKGPWDYKQRGGQYQDFGNFNYGAAGAGMGIPSQALLRGAGWAQEQAGTSQKGWGHWWGLPPYGDDPADQEWIKKGIAYAECEKALQR